MYLIKNNATFSDTTPFIYEPLLPDDPLTQRIERENIKIAVGVGVALTFYLLIAVSYLIYSLRKLQNERTSFQRGERRRVFPEHCGGT